MASLYKRASPSQTRIIRIVEGAIRNASHYHPNKAVAWDMTRSIAKRVAGTLTANWPDVSAARKPRRSHWARDNCTNRRPGAQRDGIKRRRGPSQFNRRPPIRQTMALVGHLIGAARRAEDADRMNSLIYVSRVLGALVTIDRLAPYIKSGEDYTR